VQKKFKEHSNPGAEKTGPIPFKKGGKKNKKGAVAAAKKYLAQSGERKQKGPFVANDKVSKDFIEKKVLSPKESDETIFSTEEKVTDEIRLNKYLSHAGVASRRNADELIREGRVKVNGGVITEMGYKVKPKDEIEFDGKLLTLEKKYYVLLNKPKDFITTLSDEKGRRTVMELLRGAYAQIKSKTKPRLYPVGRLDRNTTGVLLITNDGELAQKLTHPSSEIRKVYHVTLTQKLKKEDFDKIAEGGVVLEDGIAEVDEIAYPNPKNRAEVGIEIHTGKNRFIRRLFEAMGYEVEKLDRVFFAGLTKKDVPRGKWRFLDETEVRLLKHFTGK
jgi:23S rRNA pseudouridine2605 synthase